MFLSNITVPLLELVGTAVIDTALNLAGGSEQV